MMIIKEKNIKRTILTLIFIILVVSGSIITFYQYNLIKNDIQSDIDIQDKFVHKSFAFFLKELKEDITFKSNYLLAPNEVREAFANRDREKLYSLIANSTYKRMISKNKRIKIVTFRLLDGSTFLRVHKPEMFGDSLNKKRKIILDTIATQKRQYGFEVGKLKMTYRVVTPIFYENKFVGVVEVGVEPEYVIDKINQITKVESALLIRRQDIDISLEKKTFQSINQFYLARGDQHFKEKLNDISLKQKYVEITYDGTTYLIDTDVNLYNHKDEVAAKILISYNLGKYQEKFDKLFAQNIVIMLLVILITFFVLNIGIDHFLKKIDSLYKSIMQKDSIMMRQSKLADLGEMIANIAHQWRQPLSVISTSASSIQVQKQLGVLNEEDIDYAADNIVKSTQYLSQTIDDFKNFIKGDKEKHRFNVVDSIEKSLGIVKGSLKAYEIKINRNMPELIEIESYPQELTQACINIINNAKDALVSNEIKSRFICISVEEFNEHVEIKIKDNAGGIPNEILPNIFDAYFTTKENSNGTGLGLYMTKRIINDSMKGTISVQNIESECGDEVLVGAEFKIVLPYSFK